LSDETPHLVRVGELQEAAAKLILTSLPSDGWQRYELAYMEAGPVGEIVSEVEDDAGGKTRVPPPKTLNNVLKRLRAEMASPGKGAWLSTHVTVERSGDYNFSYNYDERPQWRFAPTDEAYIDDLQQYPRSPQSIPDWYPRSARPRRGD